MLQKKSAFDVLMNKNRVNNVSPSSAASATTPATFSPIKPLSVSEASPVQKENEPPSRSSSSATKKGRNLLEETITIDSRTSSPVQSEEAKKTHSFFQKREKPAKTNTDSPICLDAPPDVFCHPPVHIHQYSAEETEFLGQKLNGSFIESQFKLKPMSAVQELGHDFLAKLLTTASHKHPFYELSWRGRSFNDLFPDCQCSKNLDFEINRINSNLIYDVNINFEAVSLKTETKVRKRSFESFKTPVSSKKEEKANLDDSQMAKDASMLTEGNQSNLETSVATDQENNESPMPTTRSSKRRRTDSTIKPQAVAKPPRTKKSAAKAQEPETGPNKTLEPKNDVSIVDLSVSLAETAGKMTKKCSEEFELWTEKYQFKNENDIVTNNSQVERLREWLSNWKQILSKESTNSNSKKGKKSNSGYDSQFSDSDYTYDSDCSNADSICSTDRVNGRKFYSNAILLTGPHGSGKTSSIYSIAKILGFKVFEVNASSSRCKTQILQELDGALSSHHISSNSKAEAKAPEPASIMSKLFGKKPAEAEKPKSSISSFFKPNNAEEETDEETADNRTKSKKKKRKVSLRKETFLTKTNKPTKDSPDQSLSESSSSTSGGGGGSTVNIQKESLILFDEIEVVFKEDVNFWAAVNYFVKKFKKPIILTTTDDYLQDKINLNIEKIEFIRPRIDSSIRYLKKIARHEKISLETSTAYKILRESKCDMRRALIQLQALISSSNEPKAGDEPGKLNKMSAMADDEGSNNSTIDLSKYLDKAIQEKCVFHMRNYFDNLIFLDVLTKQLKVRYLGWNSTRYMNDECPNSFKRYDMFILRDGLTDSVNSGPSSSLAGIAATAASSASSAGPQPGQQVAMATLTAAEIQNLLSNVVVDFFIKDDLSFSYSLTYKDQLFDIYKSFIYLFNENRFIDINDWLMHGTVYRFNYPSNTAINKFAQASNKFTSNPALSMDYRPYLQKICQYEELKQQAGGIGVMSSRRRFLHYLAHLNLGLVREDFTLMSKSTLLSALEQQHMASPPSSPGTNASQTTTINPLAKLFNGDLFSEDS